MGDETMATKYPAADRAAAYDNYVEARSRYCHAKTSEERLEAANQVAKWEAAMRTIDEEAGLERVI
jgi:hypothetical protein